MGLTSALFTGLSGLNSNQYRIQVIGDNIANINTTGFKGTRASFQTQFAQTISGGSVPGQAEGGTNPTQIGLGSVLGSVQRSFLPGSIETTGILTDVAIEGDGFFILRKAGNEQAYTRDGTFTLNSQNQLITMDGFFVQGYAVDDDFNLIAGTLTDISIPLGTLSRAVETTEATFEGNLAAGPDEVVASQGTILASNMLVSDGVGTPITGATLLTDLRDASDPATLLFPTGAETITISGAAKGGRTLADATFTVTPASTVSDFTAFLDEALGLNSAAGVPGTAGITVNGTGQLVVEGNWGEGHELVIDAADIMSSNAAANTPFAWSTTQEAIGESVITGFKAYDSLGTEVQVDVIMVLESKATTGNTWRYYVESPDDTDTDLVLGSGTLTFDTDGQFSSVVDNTFAIDRDNTGSGDPVSVQLLFDQLTGLDSRVSTLIQTEQDGFPAGTLSSFTIGVDGTITGVFTNGLSRQLGQIALATFANPAGLVLESNNVYTVGPNSGTAIVAPPLTNGAGRILSGALELSNVDLSREFIGLITASTGFSAAGRVISTSNELLDQLLLIAR